MTAESDLRFLEGRGAGPREVRGTRTSDASAPASALEKPQVHGGSVCIETARPTFPLRRRTPEIPCFSNTAVPAFAASSFREHRGPSHIRKLDALRPRL